MTAQLSEADIKAFVETNLLGGQQIGREEDILLSGLVDSLGVMTLVAHIEGARGATIPPEDVTLENFTSVAAISAYLQNG